MAKEETRLFDRQYLVELNRKVLERHRRLTGKRVHVGIIENNLDEVIPQINGVGNSGSREAGLVEKAANILAFISWRQPFMDGNRRTAIVAARKFLCDNGYDLDIGPGEPSPELRELLKEVKRHFKFHPETVEQISFYISKRIRLL